MSFFMPYIKIIIVAAATTLQNVEGAFGGIIWRGPYFEHMAFLGLFAILYTVLFISTPVLIFFPHIRKKDWRKTGLIAALWALPGLIALISPKAFDGISVPLEFEVAGAPISRLAGTPLGTFSSILIVGLFGWSLFRLLLRSPKFGANLRHAIDHVWYASGILVAALFVVHEASANRNRDELADHSRELHVMVGVLKEQTRTALDDCQQGRLVTRLENAKAFCEWVSHVNYRLVDSAASADFLNGFLLSSPDDLLPPDTLLRDLRAFNDLACNGHPRELRCRVLPPTFARAAHGDLPAPAAISVEVLAPIISKTSQAIGTSVDQKRKNAALSNAKWLSFLILALLAGAKVAISSNALGQKPGK